MEGVCAAGTPNTTPSPSPAADVKGPLESGSPQIQVMFAGVDNPAAALAVPQPLPDPEEESLACGSHLAALALLLPMFPLIPGTGGIQGGCRHQLLHVGGNPEPTGTASATVHHPGALLSRGAVEQLSSSGKGEFGH